MFTVHISITHPIISTSFVSLHDEAANNLSVTVPHDMIKKWNSYGGPLVTKKLEHIIDGSQNPQTHRLWLRLMAKGVSKMYLCKAITYMMFYGRILWKALCIGKRGRQNRQQADRRGKVVSLNDCKLWRGQDPGREAGSVGLIS